MLQKIRRLIKLDDCDQEFHCVIGFNLSKEHYGCSEIYKEVVIPHLVDIDIENIDWRQIPIHIYKQIEQKCIQIISEDL